MNRYFLQEFRTLSRVALTQEEIDTSFYCSMPWECEARPLHESVFEVVPKESLFATLTSAASWSHGEDHVNLTQVPQTILQIDIRLRTSLFQCNGLDLLFKDMRWSPMYPLSAYNVWHHSHWPLTSVTCTVPLAGLCVESFCPVLLLSVRTARTPTLKQLAFLNVPSLIQKHEAEWPLSIAVLSRRPKVRCRQCGQSTTTLALPVVQSAHRSRAIASSSAHLCFLHPFFLLSLILVSWFIASTRGGRPAHADKTQEGGKFKTLLRKRVHLAKTTTFLVARVRPSLCTPPSPLSFTPHDVNTPLHKEASKM